MLVLHQFLKRRKYMRSLLSRLGERDKVSLPLVGTERHPDDARTERIEAIGLGVKGDNGAARQLLSELAHCFVTLDFGKGNADSLVVF